MIFPLVRLQTGIRERRTRRDQPVTLGRSAGDVLIESADIDVDMLGEGQRNTVLAAFARLCRALEMPLTICIVTRRQSSPPDDNPSYLAPVGPGQVALARRRDEYWRTGAERRPAYVRRVFFSARASDATPIMRETTRVLIESVLSAAGLAHRTLEASDIAPLLADCAGTVPSPGAPARVGWRESRGHVSAGEVLLRGMTLSSLPGSPVRPGWLRPLMAVRAECDIALELRPVPLDAAIRTLGRRLRTLRSDQLLRADRGALADAFIDSGAGAADALRARLASQRSRPLEFTVTAVARARDDPALALAAGVLTTAFRSCLAAPSPTHFRHLQAARSCWPLGAPAPERGKLIDSAAAATCLPWTQTNCDDPGGYRLGRGQETGLPVSVSPFDTTVHSNPNIVVLARSGQGKSYAIGSMVIEATLHGVDSIIVDPEGEYGLLAESLGGHSVMLAPGSGAALNVFDIAGPISDDTAIADVQSRVSDLIAILIKDAVSLDERRLIDEAVISTLGRARAAAVVPVLSDCLQSLPAASRVATALGRFSQGPIGSLFSRPTTMPLDGGIVDINLRDLNREFVAPATYIIGEWLWSHIRRSQRRRQLIFDEVGLLYEHASLRQLLVQLARRCRKYNTSLVVATQNAGDLLRSADGTVVATNPSIALLGGHRGAELASMEGAFSLTQGQRRFLEGAGRGEFLLLSGNRRLMIDVEVPPAYHELLTRRCH